MKNPFKVIHSPLDPFRTRLHVILVRPEQGANVGSAARAIANMGIRGDFILVGSPSIVNDDCRRLSKHAFPRAEKALHFATLKEALAHLPDCLSIATTARSGSAHRPHPLRCDDAVSKGISRLIRGEKQNLALVFGPESDGMDNDEVALCDWIATIPSSPDYRSLNLAQAVLLLSYEANRCLLREWPSMERSSTSQRQRLIEHFLRLAEATGFVLPGDPYKMRPRLEKILGQLPHHIEGAATLHGFLDQAVRSAQRGEPDFKGRYRHRVETDAVSQQSPPDPTH